MAFATTLRLTPLLGTLFLAQPASGTELADQIWSGGPILTMNDSQPRVEAIAVKDGKIIALGSSKEIGQYRARETTMHDLAGRTLLPGFVDAHGHAFMIGVQAISANLLSAPDGKVTDI